jgi:hypothetical protein
MGMLNKASFQKMAWTVYTAANKLPGVRKYTAKPGSMLDRALNKALGTDNVLDRLDLLALSQLRELKLPELKLPKFGPFATSLQPGKLLSCPVINKGNPVVRLGEGYGRLPMTMRSITEDGRAVTREQLDAVERKLYGFVLTPEAREHLARKRVEALKRGLSQAPRWASLNIRPFMTSIRTVTEDNQLPKIQAREQRVVSRLRKLWFWWIS